MRHSEFFKSLKDGTISSVYLFIGEETYVMQSALNKITDAVAGTELRELNLTLLTENPTGEEICAACETVPFMSEKRIVIVVDSGFVSKESKFDGEDKMLEYLKAPYESTVLVFASKAADKRKKGYKALCEHTVVEFDPLSDNELKRWVEKRLGESGLTADAQTVGFLCEYADARPISLTNEIDKLASYKPDGNITKEDIMNVVTPCNEYNIFKMTDAMTARDTKKALELLSGMLTQREEPIYILGAVSKHYRQLLRFKIMFEEKKSRQEIISALGIRDFVFNRMQAAVRNVSEEQLKRTVDICYETDERLKTGKMFDCAALHALIIKLCSI